MSRGAGRGWLAFALCVPLGLAGAARAAGGGGENAMGDLFWRLFNFSLLAGVLFYFARKPARDFFATRRASIESQLSEAAELQLRAERQHALLEGQLAELERERETIREGARERAEREAEQILADARAAADRIQRDAAAAIDHELRRGKASLREEASDLAVSLAADLLREQVGPEDRRRLVDEFIQSVEEAPASSLPGGGR